MAKVVLSILLPIAIPAYIIAYTYTGLLDFAGPLQSELRQSLGLSYGEYWFADVRSITGPYSFGCPATCAHTDHVRDGAHRCATRLFLK
jgi:hypothetical protein